MKDFLQQFVHYMCSRCIIDVPHHTQQSKTGGRHSHNGEILDLLEPHVPDSNRILAAYREWQTHPTPSNIQQHMAHAYNRGQRVYPRSNTERAVKLILDNINDVWLRHGPETSDPILPRAGFPELQNRWQAGDLVLHQAAQHWFAVDLDSTPFAAFSEHTVELTSGLPWTYTVGLLPYRRFTSAGGVLHHPKDRDHLYAQGQVPARHWVFITREFDEYTQNLQQLQSQRQQLLESNIPHINNQEYNCLIQLYRHLQHYTTVRFTR